jgi:gamma-glutamyltranspeptidase/glutathione hydrolase
VVDLQTGTSGHLGHCRRVEGPRGAVAAAHPLAVAAGTEMLASGGTAVDAAIAAQAVISVSLPNAAGLGGDLLALVRTPQSVTAIAGTGLSSQRVPDGGFTTTGGGSVTVPGLVDGWLRMHNEWGRLELAAVLRPAVRIAREGFIVDGELAAAVDAQRSRLIAGGAGDWPLLKATEGSSWQQPELADLLVDIGRRGSVAFYRGPVATALRAAVQRTGGALDEQDLRDHLSIVSAPVSVDWNGGVVHVQPAPTQGILLAMALAYLERRAANPGATPPDEHLLIELTGAAFEHRANSGLGARLLLERLMVDAEKASGRSGPRAYLHTAGVAAADATGMVVSSLISVFDDFGSAVFVPEAGIVLNNRAAGFTTGANAAAPGKRPVHTLAPAMLEQPDGAVLALATPGADGQVQTLLQVLCALRAGADLPAALAAPRWRSEDGGLLVEAGHPAKARLRALGHRVTERPVGADVFGAVVAAGLPSNDYPFAAADWRRGTRSGAV